MAMRMGRSNAYASPAVSLLQVSCQSVITKMTYLDQMNDAIFVIFVISKCIQTRNYTFTTAINENNHFIDTMFRQ